MKLVQCIMSFGGTGLPHTKDASDWQEEIVVVSRWWVIEAGFTAAVHAKYIRLCDRTTKLTPSVSSTSTFPLASSSICLWMLQMASKLRLAFSSWHRGLSMRQSSGRSRGRDKQPHNYQVENYIFKLLQCSCNHSIQLQSCVVFIKQFIDEINQL